MSVREIAQRELRNDVSAVLREVEQGNVLRVTVRGKAVADLVPVRESRRLVPSMIVAEMLDRIRPDPDFASDLEQAIGQTVDEL